MHFRITPLNHPIHLAVQPETASYDKEAEARWAEGMRRLRDEFEQQWTPPDDLPEDDEDGMERANIEGAAFDLWMERRKGRIAAVSKPVWMDNLEYWLIDFEERGVLAKQPTAVSLTLPFLLRSGGEITVTFETRKEKSPLSDTGIWTRLEHKKRLVARTRYGVHSGLLIHQCGEMGWQIVSMPSGTPQEVADRIAASYDRINALAFPNDYPAVMPLRGRCSFCHRPLTDPVSKIIGVGPDCAAQYGIAHSMTAANAIIEKRRVYLAEETEEANVP